MANDLQWRALADRWHFALLGTFFDGDCAAWAYPERGSLAVLDQALADFAAMSGLPDIARAPWALWGHSGGGNWSYSVTQLRPERVIANVSRSGSAGALPAAALGVPQLLAAGAGERGNGVFDAAYNEAISAFTRERQRGALVALSVDPRAGHELAQGRRLHIAYFDALISLRVPSVPGQSLRPLDETRGWLGNPQTFEITAHNLYSGDRRAAVWLPDAGTALGWREFARSGTIIDISPPPVPSGVAAVKEGSAVRVSWFASADLLSGLRTFHVYRNGVLIGSAPSPFQGIDFGDEPTPESRKMEWVDMQPGASPEYTIYAVNGDGIQSQRSAAARPQ